MRSVFTIIGLMLYLPMATAQNRLAENEYGEEFRSKFSRRWEDMFGIRTMPDEVYFSLASVSPQPFKDFVPLGRERLSQAFLSESEEWMGKVLRQEANPFIKQVKPSKFCWRKREDVINEKRGVEGLNFPRISLVLYEWQNDAFQFRLMENRYGLLLVARPRKGRFDPKKAVPAKQVTDLLTQLVNVEEVIAKDKSLEQAFHLPKRVTCGVPFHNIPSAVSRADPIHIRNFILTAKWSSCIVGFLTTDSICVVLQSPHPLPAPREQDRDLSIPDVDRYPEKFYQRWREMYGLRRLPDEVAICLAYVDPRPEKDFVPFRQERLSHDFLHLSNYDDESVAAGEVRPSFMGKVFRKEAYPYANKIKPSKYCLSKPGASDLLLYQWENRDLHLRLTESCRGLLLEARPKKGPFDPNKGVPAEQVAALLKRLLHLEAVNRVLGESQSAVPKGKSVEQAFHLPKLVQRGIPFHNMPRHNPHFKTNDSRYKVDLAFFVRFEPVWPRCIVGFLSTDALCVVIPKCDLILNGPAIPFDADWLRDALVGKDGKTRLHKPLIDRPWPRGR